MPPRPNNNNDATDIFYSDKEALDHAQQMQQATKESLQRMRQQASETAEIGMESLAQLQDQRETVSKIQNQADRVERELETTKKLQNRYANWSLRFGNKRHAKKVTKQQEERQGQYDELKAQRSARMSSSFQAAAIEQPKEEVVVEPHGRKKKELRKSKRGKSSKSIKEIKPAHGGLLDGTEVKDGNEHSNQLYEMAQDDDEINAGLDAVESQLDELLNMSQAFGQEIAAQNTGIHDFSNQISKVNHASTVATHRSARFLVGKQKQEDTKQNVLNGWI